MAARWLTLILGVAFMQGIWTLSPIPVPEDEWAEFARMLRDPQYRLPVTSSPERYEVTLTPYFDTPPANKKAFTFDGEVTIYLRVNEAVNEIVLHCNDLTISSLTLQRESDLAIVNLASTTFTCEMPYSFLRVRTSTTLVANEKYILKSEFTGQLQDNMRGFYRSWYVDSSNTKRWMGTTQFQPGHARQAFPCYDEPAFKARFDITIVRERLFSNTISNMPIKSSVNVGTDRVAETFYTTPLTSTYLLAFIVSHYDRVATNNDAVRPFHIYARDNVGETGQWALEVGVKLLEAMESYTQFPYYSMADGLDMKQAAIPDFSAGAMENWGLLTYREANILYDDRNTNAFYKQRIANIVAHEVAHMWFGNLVTCAWWDNLWLNEGFARFYQYYLTEMVAEELGYDTRFIVEQVHVSLLSDSVDTAHALTDPSVTDPASVSAHFSTITYARGAGVIRMTQYLLGKDTFIKGLRAYLQNRQYDVAEPSHLFQALDAAAAEDRALASYGGITIESYFKSWSEKAGHPLLTVTVNQTTGAVTVTQARWERDTGVSRYSDSIWDVPITWTSAEKPDFNNLKPNFIMSAQAYAFNIGSNQPQWVLFNKQQSGFYRVNYDNNNWVLLTRALRSNNRTVIHEHNRAQIVDDLFNFARAGLMSYDRIFNILSFLEFEDQYAPWIAATTGFNFARRRLAHDSAALQKLENQILQWSKAVVARLGYEERPNEPFMDGMLRMYVMTFLCDVGDSNCATVARRYFQDWKLGGYIPANMRPWVYCTGLRDGNADDFDYFWSRYLNEQLANEVVVLLQAVGCTRDRNSLEKFLEAIVDGQETIRPQDHSTAISSAITGNEENTMKVFDWLKTNLNKATEGLGSATTLINNIGSRLLNEDQITQFQTWLDQNRDQLGSAYTTGTNAINTSRNNLAWSGRRMTEFTLFFDRGYADEVLDFEMDSGDDETEAGVEEEDKDEEEKDAANVTTLSVAMLLITLWINLVA